MSPISRLRRPSRSWAWWTAGFLAFPVSGLAGRAVAGPVDSLPAAMAGGAVTGLVLGLGQSLAARRRLDPRRWVPATGAGMALGLALGAAVVGYRTSPGALAVMGAFTGLLLGPAQALALPRDAVRRWAWALALPPLWATGWSVTALAGVGVGARFTVFGATGALAFSALSGLLLDRILPAANHRPAPSSPAPASAGRTSG
ncbi:hypothetical protein [Kitasatospora sp. NPDC051914]|uniref:hypothetical protein n=1 Tax=Kitasatospora sp. NPDC051914 TaxID=3154945 RepID=UPI003448A5B1